MKSDCPHGYVAVMKLSDTVTFEDRSVTILGGMCDTADRCGISSCKFYDLSPAGHARYIASLKRIRSKGCSKRRKTSNGRKGKSGTESAEQYRDRARYRFYGG